MSHKEGVSLIICSYNGADRLPETIRHINAQRVDSDIPWELIVIDNASSDNTGQVAKKHWKGITSMRIIVELKKGLMHARLRGIDEARFEFISFIDDDNWIDPNWITNIYKIFFEHPEVGICGSRNFGAFEISPPSWFYEIEESYAIGKQGNETGDITEDRGHVWGAGLSFRNSAFEKITQLGFTSVLTGRSGRNLGAGEDTELSFAFRLAGWKLWYSDRLTLQHYITKERFEWNYVLKMYKGFGASHATFEIYRLVLNGQPYRPEYIYLKTLKHVLYYWKLRCFLILKNKIGSIDYLKFQFQKNKLKHIFYNRKTNKILYNNLWKFHRLAKEMK